MFSKSFSESADFVNDKKQLKYSVEQVLGGTQVDENYLTRLAGQVGSKYLSYIVQYFYLAMQYIAIYLSYDGTGGVQIFILFLHCPIHL